MIWRYHYFRKHPYHLRKHARLEHILEQSSFPFIQLSIKNRCRKKNVPLAPLPVEGRAPGSFVNQQDSPARRSSRVIGGYPLPKHFPYEGMVHPRTYVQLSWFSESWVPLKKLLIHNELNPWITCFSWFVHGLVAENQKPNEPGPKAFLVELRPFVYFFLLKRSG